MALVEDLKRIGISSRNARALGLHYESITAVGTTLSGAPVISESLVLITTTVTDYAVALPYTDNSKTGFHILGNYTLTPAQVYTTPSVSPVSNELVIQFGTGVAPPAMAVSFLIPAYSWAIVAKLGQYTWGAFIK